MPRDKKPRKQSTSDSDSGPDDVSNVVPAGKHNLTFCALESTGKESEKRRGGQLVGLG